MCPYLWQGLGTEFALCGIFIQQWLSSKLGHVTIRSSLWEKVQNSSDVVGSWRTCPSWTRTYKGSRRKSSRNPRKVESSPLSTEELRRQEEARTKLQPGRVRLP